MSKTKTKKLEKTLFVRVEDERGDSYWQAEQTAQDHGEVGETRRVGRYVLAEVLEVTTKVQTTIAVTKL